MQNNTTIAAIIPAYNVEKYIEKCVDSVLQQTIPFDEVIIINDGSTDMTDSIIREKYLNYQNIKYVIQENQGQSIARNKGISLTNSDYLVFIDSDDYVEPNIVSVLKSYIKNQEVILYSATVKNEINFEVSDKVYLRKKDLIGYTMTGWTFFSKIYPDNFIVSPCLMLCKVDFLKKNKIFFPKKVFYEDNFFFFKIINCATRIEVVDKSLYIRRYREGSTITSCQDIKKKNDEIIVLNLIIDYLCNIHKQGIIEKKICKYVMVNYYNKIQKFYYQSKYNINENLIKLSISFLKFCGERTIPKSLSNEIVLYLAIKYLVNFDIIQYNMLEDSEKRLVHILQKKYESIDLGNAGKSIGIYGVGAHTSSLLKLYEKYVGKIEADIYFIVTSIEDNTNEENIYDVNHIPKEVDSIIISSYVYQIEMIDMLELIGYKGKIVALYDEEEWIDLVVLEKLIKEV